MSPGLVFGSVAIKHNYYILYQYFILNQASMSILPAVLEQRVLTLQATFFFIQMCGTNECKT